MEEAPEPPEIAEDATVCFAPSPLFATVVQQPLQRQESAVLITPKPEIPKQVKAAPVLEIHEIEPRVIEHKFPAQRIPLTGMEFI